MEIQLEAARSQAQLRGILSGGADPNPAGELFIQVPVIYTCWLRDEASGERSGEAVRGEMRPRRLCGGEPRRALASARRPDPLYRRSRQRTPRPSRLRPEDESLANDLPARAACARFRLVARRRAPRLRAGHRAPQGSAGAGPTASGSAGRMPTPTSGGMCRARRNWPSRARLAPRTAPRHSPGMDGRRPVVCLCHSSSRTASQQTPANRGSGSAGSPTGMSRDRRRADRLHDLHWSPRGERLGFVRGSIEPRAGRLATATHPQTRCPRCTSGAGPAESPARSITGPCGGSPAGRPPATTWPTWSRMMFSGANGPLWSFLLVPDPRWPVTPS